MHFSKCFWDSNPRALGNVPVHVSTRGGLSRRAGRIPYPPPRRSKLHIACSDFLCLCKKVRAGSFRCSSLAKPAPCSALDSGLGTRQRRRAAICLHNLFTPLAEKTSSAATLLLLSNPNPLPWASGLFFYLRTLHFYTSPTAGQSDLITYSIDSKISHAN